MSTETASRARDVLRDADQREVGAAEVCQAMVASMHELTRFAACAVMTTDAVTMLPSGGVVEGFGPADCAPFWDNELLDPDFNKFADLARSTDPVATLRETLDGDLERSPRWRKLYAAYGIGDELRIAVRTGASCLAVGAFIRSADDGPFPPAELADVRHLLPTAAGALRRALGRVCHEDRLRAPAVLILDGNGEITGLSEGAQQVLDDVRESVATDDARSAPDLPQMIRTVALRARRSRTRTTLTTRVQGRSGQWFRVHVAPMQGDVGSISVTIEAARPDDLARILLDSYGLTARETDIVLLLARGLSAKEMAAELAISSHTVRDHIKVVYDKAGVSTRGELIAGLFANHVLAPFHEAVTHLSDDR